jgi:hypothetical protein
MGGHSIRECSASKFSSHSDQSTGPSTFQQRLQHLPDRLASRRGLQRGSCCYSCLLPSRVCANLKNIANKEVTDHCIYPWIVKAFIVILEIRLELFEAKAYISELRIDNQEVQRGIVEYMRTPIQLFGTDAIQACRVLNDLNVSQIVRLRENSEDLTRRKRYRESR